MYDFFILWKAVAIVGVTIILPYVAGCRDLSQFEYHLRKQLGAEDIEWPDFDLSEIVIWDIGLEYISMCTIRMRKYYMRRCLFMGPNMSLQKFLERLNELSYYLLYIPEDYYTPLDQDEIIKIWTKPNLLLLFFSRKLMR